jgi:hypothetical protein
MYFSGEYEREYSSPPLPVSLCAVLVTYIQPWSKNIKWKIPELKNHKFQVTFIIVYC